jgi:hypothetical protein
MPVSFVFSASKKTFVFELASYAVLISAFVWSAVAPLSIPSSLVPSVAISLLSTVPVKDMFPVILILPVPVILFEI